MLLKVDLDPKTIWRIEERAEFNECTVAEYLVQVAEHGVAAPRSWRTTEQQGAETRSRVGALHAEGFTDAEIAARVGRVREHVASVRRKLGLKPNKREETP